MSNIIVFGAGGRAGRRVVAEAVGRGHRVTAVVRDPRTFPDRAGAQITLMAGDVTSAESVAEVAPGHDVAISTVYRADVPAEDFYVNAAQALIDGLARANVGRLLVVGLGSTLEAERGRLVHDGSGFPREYRTFSEARVAELDALKGSSTSLDWVVVTPPPTLLAEDGPRTGTYRIGGDQVLASDGEALFSYADLAVALVDEAESAVHHRTQAAVGY